jgi:hypothetical protein
VAAAFCIRCGQPLPAEAQFCQSCGTPVAAPNVGPGPGPASSAGAAAPPLAFAGPPLADQLGLRGARSFLLQHLLIGAKHSYRVLDGQKRHLCSFGEDWPAERAAVVQRLFHPPQPPPGSHLVTWGPVESLAYWVIDDGAGQLRGTVALDARGTKGQATVCDATGAPSFIVQTSRSGLSKLDATVVSPDGRPMLEARGGVLQHNFSIHDAAGIEVAQVHEAWASARDTYAVDVVGSADPLGVLMLAVLIDHFKGH